MKVKVHELKIAPEYYEAIINKEKQFEIRKNDRDFKVGDKIELKEFSEDSYTHAKPIYGRIKYITNYEQKEGIVVMGIDFNLEDF